MEYEAELLGQDLGGFRHGDGNGGSDDARCVADGSRLSEADEYLLDALAHVVEGSGRFSFGILTGTLSVAEQLDFGYKLMAAAGRIRTRVEKTPVDHRLRPADGGAP